MAAIMGGLMKLKRPADIIALGIAFEGGIVLVAVGAAWLAGVSLADQVRLSPSALAWSALLTAPPLVLMWAASVAPWEPLCRVRREVEQTLVLLFARASLSDLALISLFAGVGEEALFRGVIQTVASRWGGPAAGLAVASVLFGLMHLVTPAYAVLAGLLGLYLGGLFVLYDNLLVPVAVHALYDFAALVYLVRGRAGRVGEETVRSTAPAAPAAPVGARMSRDWPIALDDVRAAEARIRRYLPYPTPLREYAALNDAVGHGIRVLVKHENHHPTNSFKIRNGLAALTALPEAQRRRGVVTATRGNHGQGVALAGQLLGVPVTICVPIGNNPDKNDAMRGFGAELVEEGRDYDESLAVMQRLARERGLTPIHSTNNAHVLAGAGTITLEIVEQAAALDAIVIAVGGGSQAVGALTVLRARRPEAKVYAVQAEGARAIYESWKAGAPLTTDAAATFADGIATRASYELTLPALCQGLAGFVTVPDAEIAEAMRLLLRTTHNLVEPAAAAGLAGLMRLREQLVAQHVAIILTGANVDAATLGAVLTRRI